MPAFARSLPLAGLALLLSSAALAGEGVYLPPAPHGSGGEDSIETAEGTRCRQSINSSGTYLDMGASATTAEPLPEDRPFVYSDRRDKEALVYVRVTIPLGRRPQRIDCVRLYELEIARLREELELTRMNAE